MSTLDVLKLATPDFWASSGYHLLESAADGALVVTDDFLRHLLQRPELAPISQSCGAEIALHNRLLGQPRSAVAAEALKKIQDADAAANYGVWLRFRDRLLAAPSLQAAYLALFQGQGVDVPPALVHELTQILLRHLLQPGTGEVAQPMHVRVAEMLFRPQKIAIQDDGMVMAADHETIERHAVSGGFGSIGELLQQGGVPLRTAELDVLGDDNAELYWQRNESFDWVICLNHGQAALAALCQVLERWVAYFLQVEVRIAPAHEINDADWRWHVGLDAQASAILNGLYTGKAVDETGMSRMLCLFKLEFANAADMLAEVAGSPVYLAMAMDENKLLKLKPQNLLLNLPLARRS